MDESTYLSRAFSDQGVRLRLRKEPRAMMYERMVHNHKYANKMFRGNKRPFPYGAPDTPISNTSIRPNMGEYSSFGEDSSTPNKRFRADTEDRKEQYSDHSAVSGPGFSSSYTPSQYPARQPSISSAYTVAQYPTFGSIASTSASPYPFRPSITNTSSFFGDNLLQTSSAGALSGSIAPQPRYSEIMQSYSQISPFYPQP